MRGNGLGNKGKIEHDASACIATLLAQQKENISAAKGTDIVKVMHKWDFFAFFFLVGSVVRESALMVRRWQ